MGVAYLAPYGVGLGHASRMLMVADHLAGNGTGVKFSSFGEAASYVSMRGYDCLKVPPVEFAWSMEGGFSVKNSLAHVPQWFTNFSRQVNQETRNMTMYSPDVIVSDSRLSPIVAARLLGIPSIVLLNQVKLLLSPRLRELAISRLFERMVGEFLGSMWAMAGRVLVPDLPPPYTIAAHNIWDISSASKLEYVGFMSPRPNVSEDQIGRVAAKLGFDRSQPIVFIHVSGPMETRMPIIKKALEAMKGKKIQFVVSEGRPRGATEPRRVGESGWYYEWCPDRDEIFAMSSLIVLRGGHTALSQAIQFGKPVITIPIENHGEQLGNSAKVAELGVGIMLHPKGLRPEQLGEAIESALADPQYLKKTLEVMKLTDKLNGIENVVKIVRSYL